MIPSPKLDKSIFFSLTFYVMIAFSLIAFVGISAKISTIHAPTENDSTLNLPPSNWSKWISLGGILAYSPSVAVLDDGSISVLAGGNNGLWHLKSNASAWGNWTHLSPVNITSAPLAIALS